MTLDRTAQIFKALSEPLRLRILHLLLLRDSLCVCDLVTVLEQGQSTISRHLTYLKNAGLVKSWREGTWMHYELVNNTPAPLSFETLKNHLTQLPESETDFAALQEYEKIQPRSCQIG